MALEKFTAASIATIDGGRIAAALEQAVERARADCFDRPGVDKSRKVTLEITLTPVPDESRRDLDSVDVGFQIKDTIPGRESKTFNMRATPTGLLFNELSPDEAAQITIDDAKGPRLAGQERKTHAG